MATAVSRPIRRRRAPAEAEREILDAADRLVRELPPSELTVARIMAATTLSRNSFYVYFGDRYELIARLVERLRGDADAAMSAFAGSTGSGGAAAREALAAAARLYRDHGELMRALHDAAPDDPAAARAWAEFAAVTEHAVTERVREEIRAGRIAGIDPEPTVRALVAMNRACFFEQLVGRPGADLDALVDVLHAIWIRALYGPGAAAYE
jgi:TetR/AcrR family transcriptional regulator, ethionamide resistance regulator